MEYIYLFNAQFTTQGEASGVVCQALRSTAFVSPEGELYPCHMWDRPLGDIRAADLASVWASAEVIDARRRAVDTECGAAASLHVKLIPHWQVRH